MTKAQITLLADLGHEPLRHSTNCSCKMAWFTIITVKWYFVTMVFWTQLQGHMGMGKGICRRQLKSLPEKAKVVILGRRTKRKKKGCPGWLGGKDSACHRRRHGLEPRSGDPHAAGQLSPRATTAEPTGPGVCALRREACAPQLQSNPGPHCGWRKPTQQPRPTQPKRKQSY